MTFDAESREIYLEGPQEELTCAKNRYQEQEGKMTERELPLPESIVRVLSTVEGLQTVEAEMAANQVEAVFILEETEEAKPALCSCQGVGNFHLTMQTRHQSYQQLDSRKDGKHLGREKYAFNNNA